MLVEGFHLVDNTFTPVNFGVFGFASFWEVKEVFEQIEKVKSGCFPINPKRIYSEN